MLAALVKQAENEIERAQVADAPVEADHQGSDVVIRLNQLIGHLGVDIAASLAACKVLVRQFLAMHQGEIGLAGIRWLSRTAHPVWQPLFGNGCDVEKSKESSTPNSDWAEIEESLWQMLTGNRREHGVYYTPTEVVDYLIEESLREFRKAQLGSETQLDWGSMRVVDPAAGGGRFVSRFAERLLRSRSIPRHDALQLLGRVSAMDIRPSALCATQLSVALTLARYHVDFDSCPSIELCLGDSLLNAEPHWKTCDPIGASNAKRVDPSWLCVIGNPPFASLSQNDSPWILRLLKGEAPEAGDVSYTRRMTDKKGARKHWLGDDYVKFLRLAHSYVDRIGAGTIGFVLGSGLIDNSSFGALRHALLTSFDRVVVVNLHGAVKRGLAVNDGIRDESVFGIEQGVALLLLTKRLGRNPDDSCTEGQLECCDLIGTRADKLEALAAATRDAAGLPLQPVTPIAPRMIYSASDTDLWREFQNGIPLDELFRRSASAIVTARDSLVVAHSKEVLVERLALLADSSVSTEEIRSTYFPRARSRRYPRGDTRMWTLDEARERLRAESDWEPFIVPVDYRPWDRRVLFYAPWMVDWPRREISDALLDGNNLCLVTRRQMVPGRPANFFWLTSRATIDGIVRSDNRGNESLYPLTLGKSAAEPLLDNEIPESNFSTSAKQQVLSALASETPCEDQEVMDYLLAVFFSREYQTKFAECLWHDGPRAFPTRTEEGFRGLAKLGNRLRRLLTVDLRTSSLARKKTGNGDDLLVGNLKSSASGATSLLRYNDMSIVTDEGDRYPATRDVWEFQVGSHQIARKWHREHRHLDRSARAKTFGSVLGLIRDTLAILDDLDDFYVRRGGFSQVHDLT